MRQKIILFLALIVLVIAIVLSGTTFYLFNQHRATTEQNAAENKDILELINRERAEIQIPLLAAKRTGALERAQKIVTGEYATQPDELVASCYKTPSSAAMILIAGEGSRATVLGDWKYLDWGSAYDDRTGCTYYVLKFTK